MIKKITSFFKWLSISVGFPILVWLVYTLYMTAFGFDFEDVSQKDKDFKFILEETTKPDTLPNILLINSDDLGYQDLGCYGSSAIKTPNIDRIAAAGIRFTNHYTSGSVCSPSRAGLMTGRYPIRTGLTNVVMPYDFTFRMKLAKQLTKTFNYIGATNYGRDSYTNGLPHKEITIAEALKQRGYATGIAGKWHLGDNKHIAEFNPMRHGFDDWLGINGANDEKPVALQDRETIIKDNIVEDQADFSQRFADRAIDFIGKNKNKPFFYYLSFTAPHEPLIPSAAFKGKSAGGTFGDVVEEMDFHIGKVLDFLEKQGLADNTIVIFTSDNGPWFEGSAGSLRGGKGQAYDGGFKVPLIVKWKGKITPNTSTDARVMNFDLYPTLLSAAGLATPTDRTVDGKNLMDILAGRSKQSPHDKLFLYHADELEAVISNDWKYHTNMHTYVWPVPVNRTGTLSEKMTRPMFGEQSRALYNLKTDVDEDYNRLKQFPAKADSLQKVLNDWNATINKNRQGWK